jgi:hypothetical protein
VHISRKPAERFDHLGLVAVCVRAEVEIGGVVAAEDSTPESNARA